MSISWGNTAALLRIVDAKKRMGGWPETFTAQQLALLQYPTNDAKDNLIKQRGMIKKIHAAVESEQLASEPNFSLDLMLDTNSSFDSDANVPGFARFGISRAMPPRPIKRQASNLATERTYLISCESFSGWWPTQNEKSSNHIQSWLEARLPVIPTSSEVEVNSLVIKMKRAALVKECKENWPTVEGDLREGSRNGLSNQAKLGSGFWDVSAAVSWARQEGKWKPDQASNLELFSRRLNC